MIEFGRLIIVTFKIVIFIYMVYNTIIIEDRKERSSLMDYWSTIGFFTVVEYITDKYGHVFYFISN
jgi:hypothetical protein